MDEYTYERTKTQISPNMRIMIMMKIITIIHWFVDAGIEKVSSFSHIWGHIEHNKNDNNNNDNNNNNNNNHYNNNYYYNIIIIIIIIIILLLSLLSS